MSKSVVRKVVDKQISDVQNSALAAARDLMSQLGIKS